MDELRTRVASAIDECVAAVDLLERSPSEGTAEEACLACRNAVQLFFFARGDFGEEATSKAPQLVDALNRTSNALEELGKSLGPNSIVWKYRENIITRQQLVDALLSDDLVRIRQVLRNALQSA